MLEDYMLATGSVRLPPDVAVCYTVTAGALLLFMFMGFDDFCSSWGPRHEFHNSFANAKIVGKYSLAYSAIVPKVDVAVGSSISMSLRNLS